MLDRLEKFVVFQDTHALSASANEAPASADIELVVAAEDVRADDNGDNEEQ